MNDKTIDVWDAATFDKELIDILSAEGETISCYMVREQEIFLSHDLGRGPHRSILRPQNEFAESFTKAKDRLRPLLESRTIRAWHYSRLTETEAEQFRTIGIAISTLDSFRARLTARVAAGDFGQTVADNLFDASPFHSDQFTARANKFWMTSHPFSVNDSGVKPLMAHWGGEVTSFWLNNPDYLAILSRIGRRCVVEVAVPVAQTNHSHSATEAVIATFGRSLGFNPSKHSFDLYVSSPLPSAAVMAIHAEADPTFDALGVRYPLSFTDVDLGRWNALPGEDH